jgi:hypothetical protein
MNVSEDEMFSRSEVDDPDKLSHSRQEEEHFDKPAELEEKTDEKPAESDEEEEIFTPVAPIPHEAEEKQEEKPEEAGDTSKEPKTSEEHEEADGEAVYCGCG